MVDRDEGEIMAESTPDGSQSPPSELEDTPLREELSSEAPPSTIEDPNLSSADATENDSTSQEHPKLERNSSRSRLSKQVEVVDDDQSPSSENSDATLVPSGVESPNVHTPADTPPDSDGKLSTQPSVDSDKSSPTQSTSTKVKLVRSQAVVCDDSSPPPSNSDATSPAPTATSPAPNVTSPAPTVTLSVSPTPSRGKHRLGKDGSQSSMSENGTSPALSRDSSVEYTDSTGVDLEDFIKMTLNKNRNDRIMLLKLETDMVNYIRDSKNPFLKFPQMTSYHRMLVHRIAAFFGLDHNIDQSGKCVVVNKTNNTRIPDFKFREYIQDELTHDDHPRRQILRRDQNCSSYEEGRNLDRPHLDGKKSRSFEERASKYQEARKRIFDQSESGSQEAGPCETSLSVSGPCGGQGNSVGSSKEDVRWPGGHVTEHRTWSSTDSSGYGTDNSSRRVHVTKASSFHGVTVLSRDEAKGRLSKNDSLSSGVSSLNSPMNRTKTIPPSPPSEGPISESGSSGCHSSSSPAHPGQNEAVGGVGFESGSGSGGASLPFQLSLGEQGQPLAIWVATSLDQIPSGSIIINPQTGSPYTNGDGSPYRWQPQSTQPSQSTVQPHHHQHTGSSSMQQQQQSQTGAPAGQQYPPNPALPTALSTSSFTTVPASNMAAPQTPQPLPNHTPHQPTNTHETASSDLSQQMAGVTVGDGETASNQVQQQQHQQQQQQQQQQQHYMVASASQQPPQSFISPHQQQHQMPGYYAGGHSGGGGARFVYQGTPGSGDMQTLNTTPQQQVVSQSQPAMVHSYTGGPYPMLGQMTVQAVETYQQQPTAYPQPYSTGAPMQDSVGGYLGGGQYVAVSQSVSLPYGHNSSVPTYNTTAAPMSAYPTGSGGYQTRSPPTPQAVPTGAGMPMVASQQFPNHYTYPPQPSPAGAATGATNHRPQAPAPQIMAAFPQVQAMPAQAFPVVRHATFRTTPPPQSLTTPGGQVKFVAQGEPRLPTTPEAGAKEGPPIGMMPRVPGMMGMRPPAQYRPTTPGDARLVGPSLQLQVFPQHRPRMMVPPGGGGPNSIRPHKHSGGGKKGQNGGQGQQQHESSPPSTGSDVLDSSLNPPYGTTTLEVCGLPSQLRPSELPSFLSDLASLGVDLRVVPPDASTVADSMVLAYFPSESLACKMLETSNAKYQLRLPLVSS